MPKRTSDVQGLEVSAFPIHGKGCSCCPSVGSDELTYLCKCVLQPSGRTVIIPPFRYVTWAVTSGIRLTSTCAALL